jgi:hypothetical protein
MVNAETEFILIHVVHYQIACRLSYYIAYMHGYGISVILIPTFGYISYHSWQFLALEIFRCEFPQKKRTQNSLVLHQIDSGLSYFAFYMHRVGTYGLLIMTFGGWTVLVMAVPCVFIPVGCFQNWFHLNSSRNYNNCW